MFHFLVSIAITEPKMHEKVLYDGVRVFISNQESHHSIFKNKFAINGPKVTSSFKENKLSLYNVKISEKIDLPKNTKDSCQNYNTANGYKKVN